MFPLQSSEVSNEFFVSDPKCRGINHFNIKMNRLTWIIGIFTICTSGQIAIAQQPLQFIEGGLNTAIKQSKITNRPVFFFCYASWCPHCKKMRQTIFTDASVADFYNQHFVCSEQDMEKGEGVEQHKHFDIKSYPTYIFIDSSGTVLYRLTGEFNAPQLILEGENALTPKKQLPYLKQQFESDESNPDKCLEYLRTLKKGGIDYTEMVNSYFATQSDRQLLSEKNWIIIANGTTEIDSREFQFVLSHQKEFASIASRERVDRKIFYLVKELLTPLVEANDTITYFIKSKQAKAIGNNRVDSLVFTYDLTLYKVNADWNAFQNEAIQSAEKYAWTSYSQLADISEVFLKQITDSAALSQAVKWTKRSLSLYEIYSNCILCSRLYQKINQKPEAIQMAQRAKEIASKDGWDYPEAEKLLKELQ
jgi:thioredoxin-related protein